MDKHQTRSSSSIASEKPDSDSLTKAVTCNVKETVGTTDCKDQCTLTVYVPILGKSIVTEKFSYSDAAAKYTSGQSITCYVNLFYDNFDTQKVSVNAVTTNFATVMTAIGGGMIAFFFITFFASCGVGYFTCSNLLRA